MATRIEDAHVNQILSRWYITMFVLEFPDLPAAHRPIHVADRARLEAELTRRGRVIPVYPPPAWLANGANGLNGVHGGSGVSNSSSSTPGLASGENASSSGESASSSNEEMTSEENDGQDSVEVRSQEQTPTPPATTQAATQYVGLLQIPTGFPTTAEVETFHNIDVNTIAATDNATADEVVTGEVVATGVVAAGVDHGQEIETQGMSVEEGVTAVGDE